MYQRVARIEPQMAGKITGMFLERSGPEIVRLLESETELRKKVREVIRVLDKATNNKRSVGILAKIEPEDLRATKEATSEENKQEVNSLSEVEPEGLRAAKKATSQEEWTEMEWTVDSGAAESVLGEKQAPNVDTVEGEKCKKGVQYEIASGDLIPNLGEKKMEAVTESGVARGITAQVCGVNKGLLSVAKVTGAGNRVVFSQRGSYIEDEQTGEKMWLMEKNGMYVLKTWVRPAGFSGHGNRQ